MATETHSLRTATSSATVTAEATHRFTISRYSVIRFLHMGRSISSATFAADGHDWLIRFYPGGSDVSSIGSPLLHLVLRSDAERAISGRVRFHFDHPSGGGGGGAADNFMSTFQVQRRDEYVATSRYHWKNDLEASGYVVNDCLTVVCTLWLVTTHPARAVPVAAAAVPPSDYHRNLGRMLESGVGADISFDIGGQVMAAHRCVLAAQSPVFRAELYGPMKETGDCINIEGVDEAVFKALLHFMYHDSAPSEAEGFDSAMAQHLLVAADRYGVERLKAICVCKLSEDMDEDNVSTTLALAEQHKCAGLKEVCLDFMAVPGLWDRIAATDGYVHLTRSCPGVFNDLIKKLNSRHGYC